MKKTLLLKTITFLCLLFSSILNAQWQNGLWTEKQAYNWCFGDYVGLEFNSGSPLPFPNVQCNGEEGSAVMSDSNGQLMFYASGGNNPSNYSAVWNKNHEFMVNGTDLLGDASSTQFGVIVPKPNNPNIYYLFTTSIPYGLIYSEIDMSLDAGNGAVTENKNIVLNENAKIEKITSVHHANGKDIWVISHLMGSNEFLAYLVTETGISVPVVSATGFFYPDSDSGWVGLDYSTTQLKISPNGTKLAAATLGLMNSAVKGVQVFDFNNETGVISNPIFLGEAFLNPVYGAEFSPNNRYVYAAEYVTFFTPDIRILQFDLDAGDEDAINNSAIIVGSFSAPLDDYLICGGIQLGPDGKIYAIAAGTLSSMGEDATTMNVINYPNNGGMGAGAGFEENTVELGGVVIKRSKIGLPTFIQSYFESGILYEGNNCFGEEIVFSTIRIPGITAITWDFGDPDSGAANTSTVIGATHVFSGPGTYTVTASITSNGAIQTATTEVTIIELPKAVAPATELLNQCADINGNTIFNLSEFTTTILDGQDTNIFSLAYFATDADRIANNPITDLSNFTTAGQTIYAVVSNSETGCKKVLPLNLVVNSLPLVIVPATVEQCSDLAGNSVFNLKEQDAVILNGQNPQVFTVTYFTDAEMTNAIGQPESFTSAGQIIYAIVTNSETGCQTALSLNLKVLPLPVVTTPANIEQCGNLAGTSVFNLRSQDIVILNGQNPNDFTITYFMDAAMTDGIGQPENHTSAGQTIYVKISNVVTGCSSAVSFDMVVTEVDLISEELIVEGCPPFNIELILSELPADLIVKFYPTEQDALNSTNAIVDTENYRPVAGIDKVYVVATNIEGCQSVDELQLKYTGCIIPKGISPNGDGMNDTFDLSAFGVTHLGIFNRYGKEVYTQDNYTDQWHGQANNGNELPTGTYYYIIELIGGDKKTGWVYINRMN
ncbi:PKD domain protein [compost metagenome]